MKKMISVFTILLTFFVMTCTASALVFYDSTFNDSDWSLTIQTKAGGGTVTAMQVATGGNPGEFREIINSVNYGPGSSVFGYHIRNGADYDPSTEGAIGSIDYSEDSIMFTGFGDGEATGPALFQNGKYYYSAQLYSNQSVWTHQSLLSLGEQDFHTLYDNNDHPDFSATGSIISFGFFRANTTTFGSYTIDAGIDNWTLKINPAVPIPEPSTMILLGFGLVGFGYLKSRNHD
ncbi:MAG: PEP-CTERM sorting domain-containing protein [Candidatus Schekmanbacteria bacterium]|nr:MAG: PEP-CTERM sorting domain-containing protein [Candidatus Schekmanbacteria bacterium]